MKKLLAIILGGIILLNFSCDTGTNNIGLEDDFSNSDGWVEVSPEKVTIPPTLKMELKEGSLDIHHYSVYCGNSEDFKCNNETVVRSVLKTSITDVVPENPHGLYYKVIAVDTRWNESEPATIHIR